MGILMSDDCLPTHIKEMRNYIAYAGSTDPKDIIQEYTKEACSPTLAQAQLVVESLEGIGLEKLSILFADRSHAEIILENCASFKKRFSDGDFETTELIAEAFTKIFEQVQKDRFELIGLTEGQINVLTGNVQILSESYATSDIQEDSAPAFKTCLEQINELIDTWESHMEVCESSPVDFNEGVETGLMRAADELRSLISQYKETVQMEQQESNNPTLTEERGDI